MPVKAFLITGALLAGLGVILGAFASHGLKGRLDANLLSAFQTGVHYHLLHALALILVAVLMQQFPAASGLKWTGIAFIAGIVLFSGSLYLLATTGLRGFGPVTPLGGLLLIAGWIWLAWSCWRQL